MTSDTLAQPCSSPKVSAATVQRIPEHSSITVTTSTYADVIEQVHQDALSRLDVLFDDDDESSG
jgi:hypothetical protein